MILMNICHNFELVEDLLEEDEAFWLCTARAEEQKGIEMW